MVCETNSLIGILAFLQFVRHHSQLRRDTMKEPSRFHLLIFSILLSLGIVQVFPCMANASEEGATIRVSSEQLSIIAPEDQRDKNPSVQSQAPIPPISDAGDAGLSKNPDGPLEGRTQIEEQEAVQETPKIPVILNKQVVNNITFFQTRIRDKFTLWLSRSSQYIPMMKRILKEFALPEDLVYLSLIESGFNPNAYSRAKAAGPWQFIKSTGKKYGLRIDEWVDERRNPAKSTAAAARYLKDLFNMFGDWDLALASYNAGEGKIKRALVKSKGEDFWDLTSTKHIKRETKDYVPKFMAATIIAKDPERYGFSDIEYKSPMLYDEISIDSPTDLSIIAKASEASLEEIKELNPDLKRNMTPPGEKNYAIHIPFGKEELFHKNFNAIPKEERLKTEKYRVRKGENIITISRKFGMPVDTLCELNSFSKNKALKEGDNILIASFLISPKKKIEYASLEKDNSLKKNRDEESELIYRVKKGDTLWDISKRFNISVEQIKKWNGLGHRNIIKSGEKLILNSEGAVG